MGHAPNLFLWKVQKQGPRRMAFTAAWHPARRRVFRYYGRAYSLPFGVGCKRGHTAAPPGPDKLSAEPYAEGNPFGASQEALVRARCGLAVRRHRTANCASM